MLSAPHATTPPRLVLVVDDDVNVRQIIRRHLVSAGYAVREATSGREALEALREGLHPELLVTDIEMSDGSGGWLLAQLGYEYPALLPRTIVVSGDAQGARAAHIATRWRCPVLAKPFTGSALVEALRPPAAARR
jgi:CheY-like chemotaxis protein